MTSKMLFDGAWVRILAGIVALTCAFVVALTFVFLVVGAYLYFVLRPLFDWLFSG